MSTTLLTTLAQSASDDSFFSDTGENPLALLQSALAGRLDLLNHPGRLVDTLHQINGVWAVIFLILGAICVFNGLRWHKGVIIILAGMLGALAGLWVGDKMNGGHQVAAPALALLFMVVALPGLRFAVALFGGLAGAFIGANGWTASGGDESIHYVGALVGLVVVGMLAFMAFKFVIVLFTTVVGATMMSVGALTVMLRVDAWNEPLVESLHNNPLIVPLLVGVSSLVGIVVQEGGGMKGLNDKANKASSGAEKKGAKPA